MKEIVQKDNKVLRQIAKEIPVKDISGKPAQDLIKDLKETLATQKDGVALSAPQIAESFRVFVISPLVYKYEEFEDMKKRMVFINPKIVWKSNDSKKMDEGCLSVRGWYGKVKRATRATVEAYNENGEKFEMEGRGLMAQIFQHEIDHLDGILFIDKAENLVELKPEEYE